MKFHCVADELKLPLADCGSMISVSKSFTRIAQACFYKSVNLRVPHSEDFPKDLRRFQQAGEHNLAMIEHLAIMTAPPKEIHDGLSFPGDYRVYTRTGVGANSRLVDKQAFNFNMAILEILNKIPNLRCLRYGSPLGLCTGKYGVMQEDY